MIKINTTARVDGDQIDLLGWIMSPIGRLEVTGVAVNEAAVPAVSEMIRTEMNNTIQKMHVWCFEYLRPKTDEDQDDGA